MTQKTLTMMRNRLFFAQRSMMCGVIQLMMEHAHAYTMQSIQTKCYIWMYMQINCWSH